MGNRTRAKRLDLTDLCDYYGTQDVHRARACHETGKTPDQITLAEREVAKRVNWFALYGATGRWEHMSEVFHVWLAGMEGCRG